MQRVQSRFYALVSLAYVLWLKGSAWVGMHRSLLMGAILIMMVGVVLLTSLSHPAILLTSPSHLRLASGRIGCGANCTPPS
jgi:hypothetical protein